jgi:ankyrin repeat protein
MYPALFACIMVGRLTIYDLINTMGRNNRRKQMPAPHRTNFINPNPAGDLLKLASPQKTNFKKFTTALNKCLTVNGNIDIQDKQGKTPLLLSVSGGHSNIAETLINAGADPDIQDFSGDTALIICAQNGDLKTTKALISARANLNLQNDYGDTALMLSCICKHTDIAKLLIKSGADIDIENNRGNTILDYAKGNYDDVVDCINQKISEK